MVGWQSVTAAVELAYRKIRQVSQAAIVENKQLSAVSPLSATSSCVASLSVAVGRAVAISTTRVASRSVELFYKPGVLAPARQNNWCGFKHRVAVVGRALRYARAQVKHVGHDRRRAFGPTPRWPAGRGNASNPDRGWRAAPRLEDRYGSCAARCRRPGR